MKRFLGAAAVAIMLAVACGNSAQAQLTDLQGNPIDGPRGIETLDQDRAAPGSAPTPNQSPTSPSSSRSSWRAACRA